MSSEKPSSKTRKRKSNGSKNDVKPIKKTKPESIDVKNEKVQEQTQFKHKSGKLIKISPEDVLKSSPKLINNDKENLENSNIECNLNCTLSYIFGLCWAKPLE